MNSRRYCLSCGLGGAALAVLLSVVLPHAAPAQRFPVRTFSERDGLRSSMVHDLAQDARGRMWFLTRAGVVRYDGFEWAAPDPRPPHQIFHYALLELDPEGGAWLAAEDPSLPLLRIAGRDAEGPELATPVNGPAANERRTALAAVAEEGGATVLALGTRGAGLHLRRGGRWRTLGPDDGLPHPTVYALEPAEGRLFVGTAGGLAVLTDGRLDRSATALLPADRRDVRALAWARAGELLWLVGPDWVGTLSRGRFELAAEGLDVPLDPNRPWLVAEPDGGRGLFFGSATRLFHLDRPGGRATLLGRRSGLASEGATGLQLDRELNLWVASARGVSRLSGLRFATWDSTQGLLEDEVSAVAERSPGELVFGHNDGLTFFRDGEEPRTLPLAREELGPVPVGRVLDLETADDGGLWVAAGHLGVARIAPDGGLRWFGGPEVGVRIDSVRLDRGGRVLLGTGAGLAELAGGRIVFIDPPELGRPRVRRIVLGRDGTLYLATPGEGLYYRPPGGAWRRARGSAVPEDELFTVLQDSAGRVWVGSAAGLLVLDGDRLVRPDARAEGPAPRIDRAVYALVEDPERRLWIGTEAGFYRWDGARLDHFSVHDGLAGSEANRAAAVVDGAGRLWLGTDGGVSLVRDRGERRPVPPPRVSLLAMEADGERSPADRPLDLAYRQNRVSFRVGAVSFRDESRITYRTRLLGHDRDWTVETGPARLELHYSALSPGAYTFEVQARSDRSRWSEVVASAPLTIARPFWLQAWFLGLSALVLVGLGFSGHRFHAQRRYAQRLEREVARRTEELVRAQKLEALGVLAGGIAHDFNNLLTVILGYVSLVQASPRVGGGDRDHLEQARRALGRARELSRRLLTFSQGGAPVTGPVPLGRVIRECADFTSRGSNVRCAVAVPEGLWPAEADEGQLSQVLNNLLINAIQAMPRGGVVTVLAANAELGQDEVAGLEAGRYVRLRVDDQGPGIPPAVLPRVFDPFFTTKEGGSGLGLATVHSIVRQHRGTVRVEPAPGGGTRFEVWLPASAARLRPVPVPAPVRGKSGGRVLVMDDQAAVLGVLEGMLRHLGYEVVATQDGDEAIASYAQALERREPFDLVILDLTVPGGRGGKETLRELLRLDPAVRAVASSGYADDPVLAEGGHDGFAAALPKPYTLDRLAETLRQAQEHPARPTLATARGA